GVPGGYYPLDAYNSQELPQATEYLSFLHPGIKYYQLESVLVQVVSGVNYYLLYASEDGVSQVEAIVYISLTKTVFLRDMEVKCAPQTPTCDLHVALHTLLSLDLLLTEHPELNTFALSSTLIEDDSRPSDTTFMLTFDDTIQQLRSLAEVKTWDTSGTILSFYTFSTAV
ncbi:unnamed protein product, partial [Sphagnum balticum]